MRIDTVLLTKNSVQPCLRDCLDSIKQGIPVNRLIVVDGGSTDGTMDIVNQFDKYFEVEILVDKGGRAKSRETGIKAVETDWFLFVDSDVVLCSDWFTRAERYMRDDVGAVWGAALQRSPTVAARSRAMSRLFGKDEVWTAVRSGRRRGFTHDTLVRAQALSGMKIPDWLYVLEDHFIRLHVESRGYRWLSVPDPFCYHFAHEQDRPKDYYLFGWCGKKIGFLGAREVLTYLSLGVPKSLWVYLNSRSAQAMKTQYLIYLFTVKGWLNG